ncbi:MAG: family 43 glycosylhydrolase, partial [Eubacteriales bacterium]|nr:family 43 glycosylhydrolase [Eubacteriales bacterium]
MENFITNPYLPEYEYIPDGEPHVFGDRVYIYGSHDRFGGERFCMNDYVCYSADIHNLKEWRYEGVIYTRTQDPRMKDGTHEFWAPDVVRGKDGRYYLYYCPDDTISSIGVAVCDTPAGKYEFHGIVQDSQGNYLGERPGDTIQFDPGVFMDEDGTVYLYSGNGPINSSYIGKEPKASLVMRLQEDMITICEEPKKLLPILGEEEGSGYEGHEFFEASSIRKFKGKYYLVYSSVALHELCYAVSEKPDRDFRFGGVLISNGDKFAGDPKGVIMTAYGNNHGGLEEIDGRYYIFYHRPTNRSMYSRQGWCEEIFMDESGHFAQVEMTSGGLNGGPLPGEGTYPAACAVHLRGKRNPSWSLVEFMAEDDPYITQDGEDFSPEEADIRETGVLLNKATDC